MKKLLIITSGGDSPGMNAAIRAVLRAALSFGWQVYGCQDGYGGLINGSIVRMHSKDVANCVQRGGTILRTKRFPEFLKPGVRDQALAYLRAQKIDALVILGGDGSFSGARLLAQAGGPKIVGIPCTIDNDIIGTEYTLGFDTACNTALIAIDKIRDTAFSLNRHFLVEVMGRSSGFLAVDVGMAGGAELIVIPELPISAADIVHTISNRTRKKMASIIVVAEAECPGRSFEIAKAIESLSGIAYKVCVLGHIQRGGSPTVLDRKLATLMGYAALQCLESGDSQKMMAHVKGEVVPVPLPDPALGTRTFDFKTQLHINHLVCTH